MKNFIKSFKKWAKDKCDHKYVIKVKNYGKNSKPSYRFCKKCGKIVNREDLKNKVKKRRWN